MSRRSLATLACVLALAGGACAAGRAPEVEALLSARLLAAEQGRLVDQTRLLLAGLERTGVLSGAAATCNQRAAGVAEEFDDYTALSRIAADGVLDCSSLPLTDTITVTDRLYFKRVMETKAFAVGELQVGRLTGVTSIVFAQPILDDAGEVRSMLIATLEASVIARRAAETEPRLASWTVLDGGGSVVATSIADNLVGERPDAEILDVVLQRKEGAVRSTDLDGTERMLGFAVIPGLPEGQDLYVLVGLAD